MSSSLILFLLINILSLFLSLAPLQYDVEKKSYGVANRYIDFTGKYEYNCKSKAEFSAFHEYLYLYLFAEITGFTSSYTFRLYFTDPSYVYMTCKVPYSGSTQTNIECEFDFEKFMSTYWTIKLPEKFPEIYDCQVSYWEKVSKSIFTMCNPTYHKSFSYSTLYYPLCNSNNQNIFLGEGTLYNHGTSSSVPNQFSFSMPVFVDDVETVVSCTLYGIEGTTRGHRCLISGRKKLKIFDTLVTYNNVKIWFMLKWDTELLNCANPERMIRIFRVTPKCTTINSKKTLLVDFSTHIFGFNKEENFTLPLEAPSYAYLECTIPKSPTSSAEKLLTCILDINKFPLYSNRKITLPTNFPDINCKIINWENLDKLLNTGVCYPTYNGNINPKIIHDPKCIKADYNMILFSSSISLTLSKNYYLFDLNVLIDGKSSVLPCELFTRSFNNETYFPIFCYSNIGNANISFFETAVTLDNKYIASFNIDSSKIIKLNICSVTEKTLFFENINIICSSYNNQYFVIAQLYAKNNGFISDYSFTLYLESPSNYYMTCTIPSSKSDIRELTYIECKLDILKFPLINQTSLVLPSQLPLEGINIINWDKMRKVHDGSSCNPSYSLTFSAQEYLEARCYKPYYNKINVNGQIAQKGKYYSFEMNTFVDGQITLLPCELKSLEESSIDYQLDCITNGTKSAEIYNTFVTDVNSKELIYIQSSHLFALKECIPTKFITINKIESECSQNEKLFKIYLYADIKGFSDEVIFKVSLEKPSYIHMKCTIPKSGESNQYIYCTIDVNKYPLISINEITLPSELYIHPECEIKNWDKLSKKISVNKCSSTYQYTFNPKKYLNTQCYLNGYNSFAVEGILETNNNNLKVRKIKFDVYVRPEYKTLTCEIYPPDVSNENSRLYCFSPYNNNVQIFPTITEDENSKELIFINIDKIFDIKSCSQENKMIYFKGMESQCLLDQSILKILIHSDMVGFNNEEKTTINLSNPSPSYLECVIPKSNTKDYIECTLDISKFPLISQNTIEMPDNIPPISNCYISNWINMNKEITTGKCFNDYSLKFSPYKSYEPKCYEKNYNAIALIGSLYENDKIVSNNTGIYSFILNSFVNGNYDNINCEIYPPDSSFSNHRMFCYTNKNNSLIIFPTMVNDNKSQRKIFINATNYNFNLLDCSSNDKFIYLKGINLKNSETFVNINFYGKISGKANEEIFSFFLDNPNYSYIYCLFPSNKTKEEDSIIECIYNITQFPLIKTNNIIMPSKFPTIQNYTLSNWDFINSTLYIGTIYSNHSIRFTANTIIDTNCYPFGKNIFSAKGSIHINDNYKNIAKEQIFKFKNYAIIDGIYTYISCRAFPINNEYQMDCYTNGKSSAKIFPTIIQEENTKKLILIDHLRDYTLIKCYYEKRKKIDFKEYQPKCIENGTAFMLTFIANTFGFEEEENIKLNIYTWRNNIRIYTDINCIIPFQINGQNISKINCLLDTKKFPLKDYTSINLPYYFPYINNCVTSNWYYIYRNNNSYYVDCYRPHDIEFSSFYKIEQKCKSKNEIILSFIGNRINSTDGKSILSKEVFNFSLPIIIDNYITDVICEMYIYERDSYYSQMDCNLYIGRYFRLYRTMVQDTKSQKFIFINGYNENITFTNCYNYSKFINFDGNMEIKPNLESSQLQLLLFSQTINFEKEETHRFNLDYPKYSYIDCVIPPSNSNNNTFITCSLDTNKFPLTKEDNIILPSELKLQNYSLTRWNKVNKTLTNISCAPEHTNIFYSLENQNSTSNCDDKGNNVITISGAMDPNQQNIVYNFEIFGMVDSQYKTINCSYNKSHVNNQIICLTKGRYTANIFQTMGLDTQNKNNILIKVKNQFNYTLCECKASSSTLTIALVVVSVVVALIIAFVLFIIIKKKRRESSSGNKINSLINEVGELQEK